MKGGWRSNEDEEVEEELSCVDSSDVKAVHQVVVEMGVNDHVRVCQVTGLIERGIDLSKRRGIYGII